MLEQPRLVFSAEDYAFPEDEQARRYRVKEDANCNIRPGQRYRIEQLRRRREENPLGNLPVQEFEFNLSVSSSDAFGRISQFVGVSPQANKTALSWQAEESTERQRPEPQKSGAEYSYLFGSLQSQRSEDFLEARNRRRRLFRELESYITGIPGTAASNAAYDAAYRQEFDGSGSVLYLGDSKAEPENLQSQNYCNSAGAAAVEAKPAVAELTNYLLMQYE